MNSRKWSRNTHGLRAQLPDVRLLSIICFLVAGLQLAHATPPAVTGPVRVLVPPPTEFVVVNLRQQLAVTGSAPMRIEPVTSGPVLINGQLSDALFVVSVEFGGNGAVCLLIANNSLQQPIPADIQFDVTLTNGEQRNVARMVLLDAPGAVVNTEDPAQTAACSDPNSAPRVNAGPDRTIADSDGRPGETVTLQGSATDAEGDALIYSWTNAQGAQISTSPAPTLSIPDGSNVLRLTVTDQAQSSTTDEVIINIGAAQPPTANAGSDRVIVDTDQQPGETITLDGSQSSDPDGTVASYEWFERVNAQTRNALGSGPTLSVRLPNGVHEIELSVTDNSGLIASHVVRIRINAPEAVTADAGADQQLADSDHKPGEEVTLTGAASDANDAPLAYEWFLNDQSLGTGSPLTTRLPDGDNLVRFVATNAVGTSATDTLLISIGVRAELGQLQELPNLTPNERNVAVTLDRVCRELDTLQESTALTPDQQDLLDRCNGIYFDNTPANQTAALGELGAEQFAAARTQTLLFANLQYVGVMDRLMALRGGARGLSLAGLNLMIDGERVPLADMQDMMRHLFGGGASSDADEPGGLLSDRWGMWARGNYSFGEKDATVASPGFDADQWAMVGGVDYRLSDQAVIGGALAYGSAGIDFSAAGEGGLDVESYAVSLYASMYAAKNLYLDAIVNVASSAYDADRRISYIDGTGSISADASGDTDGMTLSAGASVGYDFLLGGLTLSPTAGFFYIDGTIDGFTEKGAAGLNLVYDEQQFKSLTSNVGMRLTYAWKTRWGVVLPHMRADFVREFEDDVDVFGVRFAADPNAASAPPLLIQTENADQSYWRVTLGCSAQFQHGVSAYIEYQRLVGFEFLEFQDVSFGLRMQRGF